MLRDHNYIVLGAAGGIGSHVCRRLHAAGARLMLVGRSAEPLGALGLALAAPHRVANATVVDEVEQCFDEAVQELGSVHGVVNAVGSLLLKPAHITTAAEWDQTLAANLTSAFAAVRAAARVMKEAGGSIVLVSSAAAQTGLPNHEAIAAAKAGVIGLMRSAAATYAGRRIRVNAVAPGLIQTPLTQRIWSQPKSAEASRSLHALGRLGTPDDVAALIVWLLDPAHDWITGQVMGVDGGLASVRVPPATR